MGYGVGNCGDTTCACANVEPARDSSALTANSSGDMEIAYNSSTQAHPTITFNAELESGEVLRADLVISGVLIPALRRRNW